MVRKLRHMSENALDEFTSCVGIVQCDVIGNLV
jgi:hypothetical protein